MCPITAILLGGVCALGCAAFYYWQNSVVDVEKIVCALPRLPKEFDGLKIACVSDLHDKEYGRENERLARLVQSLNPDIIAITGDLTNKTEPDPRSNTAKFAAALTRIAPTFYVLGNHESYCPPERFNAFADVVSALGVRVLRNETVEFRRGDDAIVIAGIDDPFAETRTLNVHVDAVEAAKNLGKLDFPEDKFVLLLSHRPELIDLYAARGVDLALAGHAHGGQFRFPFIGGLFAPGQGVFPRYTSGVYRRRKTVEIVSRGLGPSKFPMRLFNRPHLIQLELRRKAEK
ncbi:MAG: metallophosphoesterase [Thermoguttaceae bacterium]|nr:metallophosphoesterase [Thermoguttaceae bacterium]